MKRLIALCVGLMICCVCITSVYSQDVKYHGADSVFEINDIAVFWAVLKGPDTDTSKVYISIVPCGPGKEKFARYSAVSSNVFSGEEETIVDFAALENENLIIQEYKAFNKMSKRRLFFFGPGDSRDNPSMEIYYIGVPDTAPEFLLETQIQAFFEHSMQMIQS